MRTPEHPLQAVWTTRGRIWSPDGRFPLGRRLALELHRNRTPPFAVSSVRKRFLDRFQRFLASHGYRLAFVANPWHSAPFRPAASIPDSIAEALRLGTKEREAIEQVAGDLRRQGVTLRIFRQPPPSAKPLPLIFNHSRDMRL